MNGVLVHGLRTGIHKMGGFGWWWVVWFAVRYIPYFSMKETAGKKWSTRLQDQPLYEDVLKLTSSPSTWGCSLAIVCLSSEKKRKNNNNTRDLWRILMDIDGIKLIKPHISHLGCDHSPGRTYSHPWPTRPPAARSEAAANQKGSNCAETIRAQDLVGMHHVHWLMNLFQSLNLKEQGWIRVDKGGWAKLSKLLSSSPRT